jgi:hypothetical protein
MEEKLEARTGVVWVALAEASGAAVGVVTAATVALAEEDSEKET